MDTAFDFIKPEFLHLLFFQQKNLVIYPYVDLKHLRGLEVFTIGYNLIDLESTALYDLKEVILNDSYSDIHTPNFYLIYNLDKKKAKDLLELKDVHCILNVNQNITNLLSESNNHYIFYNKKTDKFLNYDFSKVDLKFEQILISLADNIEILRDNLQNIKITANHLYIELNNNPDSINLSKILKNYDENEFPKILEFTKNYYNITLPEDILAKRKRFYKPPEKIIDFSGEFDIITNQNKKLREEFIQSLHEYQDKHVNKSNLELRELYSPQLLYNYLRKHHWKEGIPKNFLEEWIGMNQTKYELQENDYIEFEEILTKLKIPQKIITELISGTIDSNSKSTKTEITKQKERTKNPSENSNIPSVSDFAKFKKWILKELDTIEKNL